VFKYVNWAIPAIFRIEDVSKICVWHNSQMCLELSRTPGVVDLGIFSLVGQ
jgi:hypothetical protein